jgi:hypothetical protein
LFSGAKYLSKAAVTFITSLKAAQANILPPKQKKPANNYRLANRGKCIEIFGLNYVDLRADFSVKFNCFA